MTELIEQKNDVIVQEETLTFAEELAPTTTSRVDEVPIRKANTEENYDYDIKSFLQRWVLVKQVEWVESNPVGFKLAELGFPKTLLKVAMIFKKLSGFKYFKATVEVRTQTNAQPMQAGGIKVAALPMHSPDKNFNTQILNRIAFSQLPGSTLNLMEKEPLITQLPFIYPNSAYDLQVGPDDWSNFYAFVFTPLRSGPSGSSCTISFMARFVNVELIMPVNVAPIQEVEILNRRLEELYNQRRKGDKIMELKYRLEKIKPEDMVIQIGGEESKVVAGGPIEKVMEAVGSVAGAVGSMGIPILSDIAGVVNVASGIGKGIASIFGWSKPDNNTVQMLTKPSLAKGMNNSDYPNEHHQMALSSENKLDIARSVYGTDSDEMAMGNIVSVPTAFDSFVWKTSDAVNAKLWETNVTPMFLENTRNLGAFTSSMCYWTACFEQWRGSINYVLQFFKTCYHSGRVILVWFNVDADVPDVYDAEFAQCPQMLVDLSDARMEFGVNIPMIQGNTWLSTDNPGYRQLNGKLAVYVINPLRAVSVASQSIDVVVWHYAGSDFATSIPRTPAYFDKYLVPQFMDFQYTTKMTLITNDVTAGSWHFEMRIDNILHNSVVSTWTISETTPLVGPVKTPFNIVPGLFEWEGQEIEIDKILLDVENTEVFVVSFANGSYEYITKIFTRASPVGKVAVVSGSTQMLRATTLELDRSACQQGLQQLSIMHGETSKMITTNLTTIGEQVSSIRALAKRYLEIYDYEVTEVDGTKWINFQALAPQRSTFGYSCTYVDYFLSGFRFQSGSMRYKLTLFGRSEKLIRIFFLPSEAGKLVMNPAKTQNSNTCFFSDKEGQMTFEIPYYNRNDIAVIGDVANGSLLQQNFHTVAFQQPEGEFMLHKSIGEDFSLGFYMGAPALQFGAVKVQPE